MTNTKKEFLKIILFIETPFTRSKLFKNYNNLKKKNNNIFITFKYLVEKNISGKDLKTSYRA